MGWIYQDNQNDTWEADDYKQDPALRGDNIHKQLIGQDKDTMDECFYGILEPPMTDEFFAGAEKEQAEDGIGWEYVLEESSTGAKTSIVCTIGKRADVPVALEIAVVRDNEAIYMKRYEWAYWNHYANSRAIEYGRQKYPEVPDTRWDRQWATWLSYGLAGDRGMEEDLVSITWGEVSAENAEEIARALYEHTLKDLLGRSSEITNGTITVRLDEYNMKKMIEKAEAIKAKYGTNKVVTWENPLDPDDKEYAPYTGEKYYERVKKMVDVARRIMSKELVPDLLDKLPLKKDGTFKQDQTIVIFDGKISDAANYGYYTSGDKMCLGITTGNDWWSENKGDVNVNSNTGRLAIITLNTTRKLYPLLSEELKIQDIKTKTQYLKQDDVKCGSVYAEKSGTEYLYVKYEHRVYQRWDGPHEDHTYLYTRYTKKIADAVKNCETLWEMQVVLDEMNVNWSCRSNPRKFVSFVKEVVPEVGRKSDKVVTPEPTTEVSDDADAETGDATSEKAGAGCKKQDKPAKKASKPAAPKTAKTGERFINDDAKVKNGGRKAARITEDELREKILEIAQKYDPDVDWDDSEQVIFDMFCESKTLAKDNKYGLDSENVHTGEEGEDPYLGIHTIGDLVYCGALVGGDWQVPGFIAVYWDGKKLRSYTPTYGNCVNAIEKCAIGDEDDSDNNKHKAKYEKLGAWRETEYGVEVDYPAIYGQDRDDVEPNWGAVMEDLASRVVVE